jgi:hypothetical protein
MAVTAAARRIQRSERQEWIDRETYLWNKFMNPRTYSRMTDQDGKPESENKKVAYSWKLYSKWLEH